MADFSRSARLGSAALFAKANGADRFRACGCPSRARTHTHRALTKRVHPTRPRNRTRLSRSGADRISRGTCAVIDGSIRLGPSCNFQLAATAAALSRRQHPAIRVWSPFQAPRCDLGVFASDAITSRDRDSFFLNCRRGRCGHRRDDSDQFGEIDTDPHPERARGNAHPRPLSSRRSHPIVRANKSIARLALTDFAFGRLQSNPLGAGARRSSPAPTDKWIPLTD